MSPVPDHGEENYKGSGRHRNRPVRTNIVPDGPVGQQAFAAIREAIRKEGMATLGKVVFTFARDSAERTFRTPDSSCGLHATRGQQSGTLVPELAMYLLHCAA
jgi:hypothetical protein